MVCVVLILAKFYFSVFIITARQRSFGKVIFSLVSVCSHGSHHVTITHDAWCIDLRPSPALPPARDIWWASLKTCSNLFIWRMRAIRILLESFLVTDKKYAAVKMIKLPIPIVIFFIMMRKRKHKDMNDKVLIHMQMSRSLLTNSCQLTAWFMGIFVWGV